MNRSRNPGDHTDPTVTTKLLTNPENDENNQTGKKRRIIKKNEHKMLTVNYRSDGSHDSADPREKQAAEELSLRYIGLSPALTPAKVQMASRSTLWRVGRARSEGERKTLERRYKDNSRHEERERGFSVRRERSDSNSSTAESQFSNPPVLFINLL